MRPTATYVPWSVCRSVCLSVGHNRVPYKNGCTDQGGVWNMDSYRAEEPCIMWGLDSPREGALLGMGILRLARGQYSPPYSLRGSSDAAFCCQYSNNLFIMYITGLHIQGGPKEWGHKLVATILSNPGGWSQFSWHPTYKNIKDRFFVGVFSSWACRSCFIDLLCRRRGTLLTRLTRQWTYSTVVDAGAVVVLLWLRVPRRTPTRSC